MIENEVTSRMQDDWNSRAKEDANFYVAFGRRQQDTDEFFETGAEVIAGLDWELQRLGPIANRRALRALEIGCGPGRLLRPMSTRFGEVHGVDVSDEMIRRAGENLRQIPHAHVHHTSGADLSPFADDSFDFVYSYAVFQHIPDKEVVRQYWREAVRVMKPGGLLRAQINGLPDTAPQYDTWSGVRFTGEEVADFVRDQGLQLLALEGVQTQYMWTTWLKRPPAAWVAAAQPATRIERITNAHNGEPAAPARGRFAALTIWVRNLPEGCDLNTLQPLAGEQPARPCYLGPRDEQGLQQLNVILPDMRRTGMVPIELQWHGHRLCPPAYFRIIPALPPVPRLFSVTDGTNLMSGVDIISRSVKVTLDETPHLSRFEVKLGSIQLKELDFFCADPVPPRWEVNFRIPREIPVGQHILTIQLDRRIFPPVVLNVIS